MSKTIFITGATGFVGRATVPELIAHGYKVTGLVRSETSAKALEAAGGTAVRGDLESLDVIKQAALAADGVIHLGFIHDLTALQKSCEVDRNVIAAIADAYTASDRPTRPIVITTATLLPVAHQVTEQTESVYADHYPRGYSEKVALEWAAKGAHVVIVRLAPTVHDEGDTAFMPTLINLAKQAQKSGYPGTGENKWTAVHRKDAAVLFRLAVEKAPSGQILHAFDEKPFPVKDIARAIGDHLNLPTVALDEAQAQEYFKRAPPFFSFLLTVDNNIVNEQTRNVTGWVPTHKTLLEDLKGDYYYNQPSYLLH